MKRFATLAVLAAAITVTTATASASGRNSVAPQADPVTTAASYPAAGELTVNSVIVRRDPSPTGKKIKVFHYFRPDYRVQEIFAIATKTGSDGQPWYHVSVPMRPNGTTGWIPAKVADLTPTVALIVVHRGSRTIDVYRNGKHKVHAKVAVGAPGMETPLGHYYVAATFVPYHDPFLGVYALETSAYSKLTEWPGGGVVGIHGTNEPWLLGKAVSHGCIRVANSTASALKRLTPLGTPILILKG
jgi:lipoprotein-anchoring transpeptidase ErfK/SrfK